MNESDKVQRDFFEGMKLIAGRCAGANFYNSGAVASFIVDLTEEEQEKMRALGFSVDEDEYDQLGFLRGRVVWVGHGGWWPE